MVSTLSAAQFQTAPSGAGVRNLELEPDPDPNPNIVIVDAGDGLAQGLLARAEWLLLICNWLSSKANLA